MAGARLRLNLTFPPAAATLMLCLCAIGAAHAEPNPDRENGRFAMSPLPDGVMRLDTRTGDVSICSNTGTGWACYAVLDERAALDAEIGRLQADNEKLKSELLAAREPTVAGKTDEPLPKTDSLKPESKVESSNKSSINNARRFACLSMISRNRVSAAGSFLPPSINVSAALLINESGVRSS